MIILLGFPARRRRLRRRWGTEKIETDLGQPNSKILDFGQDMMGNDQGILPFSRARSNHLLVPESENATSGTRFLAYPSPKTLLE